MLLLTFALEHLIYFGHIWIALVENLNQDNEILFVTVYTFYLPFALFIWQNASFLDIRVRQSLVKVLEVNGLLERIAMVLEVSKKD